MASGFNKVAALSTNTDGIKDELMSERFVIAARRTGDNTLSQ